MVHLYSIYAQIPYAYQQKAKHVLKEHFREPFFNQYRNIARYFYIKTRVSSKQHRPKLKNIDFAMTDSSWHIFTL